MNLLDCELIRKYFGCDKEHKCEIATCGSCMAFNIFYAMRTPIAVGDRVLYIINNAEGFEVREKVACSLGQPLYPFFLRLPDRFQTKACEHEGLLCPGCGAKPVVWQSARPFMDGISLHTFARPCGVPDYILKDKVQEIVKACCSSKGSSTTIWSMLWDLVKLARGKVGGNRK
jgi:hypothetical protein